MGFVLFLFYVILKANSQSNGMENNEDLNNKKIKKDSFYKHQQQRLQHLTLNKDLSADDLIKNILQKVDTDAKITKFYNNHNQNTQKTLTQTTQIPPSSNPSLSLTIPQCFLTNPEIPEIYLRIWNSVQNENMKDFCHRDKLYQILLSSSLSNDVLAKLWSFVNRTKPGELNRNELFVMLALIGLVQKNVPNPFNELYNINYIPIPCFAGIYDSSMALDQRATYEKLSTVIDDQEPIINLNENENEFCDFKSAELFTDKTDDVVQTVPPESSVDLLSKFSEEAKILDIPILDDSKTFDNTSEKLLDEVSDECDFQTTSGDHTAMPSIPMHKTKNLFGDDKNDVNLFDIQNFETEEFGDFHSQPLNQFKQQTSPIAEQNKNLVSNIDDDDCFSIKLKILTSIKQVMHKTFNILAVNHDEESVIEALSSENGTSFANDLYEVFLISKRIKSNYNGNLFNDNDNDNNNEVRECAQFSTILDEIHSNWNSINNLLKKASIKLSSANNDDEEEDLPSSNEPTLSYNNNTMIGENEKCFLCSADLTRMVESSRIRFNDHIYHTSCANFWLNYVDPSSSMLLPPQTKKEL